MLKALFATPVFLMVILATITVYDWLFETAHESALNQHRALSFSNVYAHHGDNKTNVPFKPGDHLFVHYDIERYRTCIVTIQFRLTWVREGDAFTGRAAFGYPQVSYYSPAGHLETNEYFEIPRGMPPGNYELRRSNIIDCGSVKWVEFAPAAPFVLLPSD